MQRLGRGLGLFIAPHLRWLLDEFFFLYRTLTIKWTLLQPVLVLLRAAYSTQDPQIDQQPPSHLYLYVQISIGCLHSTSLRCDATAGSADRGQKVISFLTVYPTWVSFIRSNWEKKGFTECFKKKLTEKKSKLKALEKTTFKYEY